MSPTIIRVYEDEAMSGTLEFDRLGRVHPHTAAGWKDHGGLGGVSRGLARSRAARRVEEQDEAIRRLASAPDD
jgi:hypothetical protein